MPKKPGKTLLTVLQYAEHRGVSRRAVYDAIAKGSIAFEKGLIDRGAADRDWVANGARSGNPDPGAGGPGTMTLNRAQTVLTLERAQLVRLEREERQEKILEQQRHAAAEHARQVTEALESFPSRLTPKIAVGVTRAEYLRIEHVSRDECRRLREDLARAPAEESA